MKKKIVISAIVLAGLGLVGYLVFGNKKTQYKTHEASRVDLVQTVSATGDFRADTEIDLNFELTGRIAEIKTAVGKEVAEGDVLAMIEDKNLSSEASNAKAALDKALAQSGLSEQEVKRLESEVSQAEQYLSDVKKLESEKVDTAEQSTEDAEKEYKDAKEYYQKVVSESGASSSTAKNAKLTLNKALTSYNYAKQNEETVKKTRELNITSAENSLETAKSNVEKAASKPQENYDEATVSAAQAQYQIALNNLDKAALKAPVSGKVTKLNNKKGEIITNGLTTPFGEMIAKDLLIEANVAESDIAKINLQNKGVVTFDSLGDEVEFETQVISIDPAATVIQDVVYYLVKFKLGDDFDPRLKPGMTANIDIVTNEKKRVLAIPERLVKEEDAVKYVEILDQSNQPKRVDIKTGMRADEGMIEIVSGLKEGEQVIASSTNS